jgi:hypothetical protein
VEALKRAALLLLLLACEKPEPPVPPQLSAIQARIFTPNCTFSSCHSDPGAGGDLTLTPGKSFAQLVSHACDLAQANNDGYLRVAPGDPAHSFLLLKLHSIDPKYGGRMPQDAPALSDAEIASIQEWIVEGAQDN